MKRNKKVKKERKQYDFMPEEGTDEYVAFYEKKLLEKEDIEMSELLTLSKSKDPGVRLAAVKQMCPCKVLDDYNEIWDRLFNMVKDEDAKVRMQVMHNICDGSPPELEMRVVDALEDFNRDTDKDIKRKAHKVIASYQRTGKWNVL